MRGAAGAVCGPAGAEPRQRGAGGGAGHAGGFRLRHQLSVVWLLQWAGFRICPARASRRSWCVELLGMMFPGRASLGVQHCSGRVSQQVQLCKAMPPPTSPLVLPSACSASCPRRSSGSCPKPRLHCASRAADAAPPAATSAAAGRPAQPALSARAEAIGAAAAPAMAVPAATVGAAAPPARSAHASVLPMLWPEQRAENPPQPNAASVQPERQRAAHCSCMHVSCALHWCNSVCHHSKRLSQEPTQPNPFPASTSVPSPLPAPCALSSQFLRPCTFDACRVQPLVLFLTHACIHTYVRTCSQDHRPKPCHSRSVVFRSRLRAFTVLLAPISCSRKALPPACSGSFFSCLFASCVCQPHPASDLGSFSRL